MTPAAPGPSVSVWALQKKKGNARTRKPWIVRWTVDGKEHSKAFDTNILADDFRSRLLIAARGGERFDTVTGLPVAWSQTASMKLHVWARRWLDEEWPTWSPRTRASHVEALARWLPLAVDSRATDEPDGMRAHLTATLSPDAAADAGDSACARWLDRWSLPLSGITPARLAEVERELGIGDAGQQLDGTTTRRWLQTARACVRRAVQLEIIERDPWPVRPKGRARRKAVRKTNTMQIDVRRLPEPASCRSLLDAIVTHQPGSRMYRAMSATMLYAGLRPSEVVDLPGENVHLPAEGWGWIDVLVADVGHDDPDESGEPKTGERRVPIPQQLCVELRDWVEQSGWKAGPLFRSREGNRPSKPNWSRALKRACDETGIDRLRPYDFRHTCATLMLRAGVPVGEAARRLGHSVETLLSTYAGVLEADEELANERIDAALGG